MRQPPSRGGFRYRLYERGATKTSKGAQGLRKGPLRSPKIWRSGYSPQGSPGGDETSLSREAEAGAARRKVT